MREGQAVLRLLVTGAIVVVVGCGTVGSRSQVSSPRVPALKSEAERTAQGEAVESMRARARLVVAETVRRIGERTGRPDPDPGAIGVEVELGRVGETACRNDSLACTSGYGDSVIIELAAESFLSGAMDLDVTARHEAIHAYLRRQLGRRQYRGIPAWLQEGLAIHLAGQTEEKLLALLYEEPRTFTEKLAGLEAPESIHQDQYAEYALAFQFLDGFPCGVHSLLQRILEGVEPYEAIGSVTGLERGEFLAAARTDAKNRLEALAAAMPREYQEAVDLQFPPGCGKKDIARIMELFESVFTAAGIDLARGVVADDLAEGVGLGPRFALARWAVLASWHSDRLPECIEALRRILSQPPRRFGESAARLRDSLARGLERQKRLDEALVEYERVARLHHDSTWYQNYAVSRIVGILYSRGRYEESLEWIERYGEPGTQFDEEIAYQKGLTLCQLGRKDEGLRVLERLAAEKDGNYPQHARKIMAWIEAGRFP